MPTAEPKRPGQYDRNQSAHHPFTGNWTAPPAGVPMLSYEIASYVGITTQSVCNRFSQEPYPEGYIVRKTKNRATIYIRMDAVATPQETATERK